MPFVSESHSPAMRYEFNISFVLEILEEILGKETLYKHDDPKFHAYVTWCESHYDGPNLDSWLCYNYNEYIYWKEIEEMFVNDYDISVYTRLSDVTPKVQDDLTDEFPGCWNESTKRWVFTVEKKDSLIDQGVSFINDNPKEDEMEVKPPEALIDDCSECKCEFHTCCNLYRHTKPLVKKYDLYENPVEENNKNTKKRKRPKFDIDATTVEDELSQILEDHFPPMKAWVGGNLKEKYLDIEIKFKTLKEAHDYYLKTLKEKINKDDVKYGGIMKCTSGYMLKPNKAKGEILEYSPNWTPEQCPTHYKKWIFWNYEHSGLKTKAERRAMKTKK